jgi:uncharacterized membrane protein YhfC
MTIPALSIVFMIFSVLVSIALPVAIFIFIKIKYKATVFPMLIGMASFILAVLVLEQFAHSLFLSTDADGNITLLSKPILYMLYGSFMAGIFEESARYVSFRLMRKKYSGFETSLAYGIGHGGIESIMLVGLVMLNNLVFSIAINNGSAESLTAGMQPDALAQFESQVGAMAATAPYMYLIAGVERILAMTIHLSLSVIVYFSVVKKGQFWLFPLAIVLHAVANFPAALAQAGVLKNTLVVEGIILVVAVLLVFTARFIYMKNRDTENAGGTPIPE